MDFLKKLFFPFDTGKQITTALFLVFFTVLVPLYNIPNIWGEYLGTMGVLLTILIMWGLHEEFGPRTEP